MFPFLESGDLGGDDEMRSLSEVVCKDLFEVKEYLKSLST